MELKKFVTLKNYVQSLQDISPRLSPLMSNFEAGDNADPQHLKTNICYLDSIPVERDKPIDANKNALALNVL